MQAKLTSILRKVEHLSWEPVLVSFFWVGAAQVWIGYSVKADWWILLSLATWLTYTADHWLDVRRDPIPTSQRHAWMRDRVTTFPHVWVPIFAGSLVLGIVILPARELFVGLILTLAVLLYLAFAQRMKDRPGPGLPKRVLVALLFTAGLYLATGLPLLSLGSQAFFSFFFCACLQNLALISLWERPTELRVWSTILFVASLGSLLSASILAWWMHGPFFWISVYLILGYAFLDRRPLSIEAKRRGADLILASSGLIAWLIA